MEKHLIRGLETCDEGVLQGMRDGINARLRSVFTENRERIMTASNPIREAVRHLVDAFFDEVEVTGRENIPAKGRVVMAPNHPFGFLDTMVLLQDFLDAQRGDAREWAIVGQMNQLHRNLPGWDTDPRINGHVFSLQREGDPVNGRVKNALSLMRSAVDFLRSREDPILFMDPEGSRAYFKSSVQDPYRGFAAIARNTDAQIVPVLFTGSANIPELTFKIRGKILPALRPSSADRATTAAWKSVLTKSENLR